MKRLLQLVFGVLVILLIAGIAYQRQNPHGEYSIVGVPEGKPVTVVVQVQRSPDNYGLDGFLILKDQSGSDIAAVGNAWLSFHESADDPDDTFLWSKKIPLRLEDFQSGTKGAGAFEQAANFAPLGHVTVAELGKKSGDSVEVRLRYELMDDTILKAKDSVTLP